MNIESLTAPAQRSRIHPVRAPSSSVHHYPEFTPPHRLSLAPSTVQVSFQEFVKGVPPSETAVTIVTCEIVEEVESLYRPKLVDAKIFPHGGTNDFLNPEEVRHSAQWSLST